MKNLNPSGFLFPILTLKTRSTEEVADVLTRLQDIFRGCDNLAISTDKGQTEVVQLNRINVNTPAERIEGSREPEAVTDSGYASAEEEEDDIYGGPGVDADRQDIFNFIRNDPFERDFTIRWLTGFIARSTSWCYPCQDELSDEQCEERELLIEMAASLMSSYAGASEEDEALIRRFDFTLGEDEDLMRTSVTVELNDAPLLSTDYSSVGLQSWASSIIFARLLCQRPKDFGLKPDSDRQLRILELGAGTGLLSIVTSKLLSSYRESYGRPSEVVATDYHPNVLANLNRNVDSNCPSENTPVHVTKFDWQYPSIDSPFDREFDIILAADVIYNPCHASWIKTCVSGLLKRPSNSTSGGCFFMAIPIRTTGRHEGMDSTVLDVFPLALADSDVPSGGLDLKSTVIQDLARCDGVGRADETGYRLFKICWV